MKCNSRKFKILPQRFSVCFWNVLVRWPTIFNNKFSTMAERKRSLVSFTAPSLSPLPYHILCWREFDEYSKRSYSRSGWLYCRLASAWFLLLAPSRMLGHPSGGSQFNNLAKGSRRCYWILQSSSCTQCYTTWMLLVIILYLVCRCWPL